MILIVHNRYRSQAPSGENIAVARQQALLTEAGIPVQTWYEESDTLAAASLWTRLRTAWQLAGDAARRRTFVTRLRDAQRDGVTSIHLHNPWPLITYDLALAAQDVGLPVVQTLHNYRLFGTNSRLVVDGALRRPADDHERHHLARMANHHGRLADPCYNRALRHWWEARVPQTTVATYCCLTRFQQRLAIAAGLPAERTTVLPNFLDHRGPVGTGPGDYALFVGRLDATKGIDRLMRQWPHDGPPLRVIGDGPLAHVVTGHPRITRLGPLPFPEVQRQMAEARLLVMNSTWYEPFGLVLIEALASGTPCLVPDLGGMPEIITDGVTGAVFSADDATAFAPALTRLWQQAPALRPACKAAYDAQYTPTHYLRSLSSAHLEI